MLAPRFELHRPDTLEAALRLLADLGDDAAPYAGGTELLVAMKARVLRYAHIVDLKGIASLKGVRALPGGGISIGALTTHHQLCGDPLVRAQFPAYAELSTDVANIRVRVAGTLGGNLCFAEPHADPPALLCALDAQLRLVSPRGERTVPMREFILGEFTTAREPDELLVSVDLPALPAGAQAAYRAFGHLERPAAGVAVVREPSGAWRAWAGAVSGQPVRLEATEHAGQGLSGEQAVLAMEQAAVKEAEGIDMHDDIHGSAEYKRHLVSVLVRRAAQACQP